MIDTHCHLTHQKLLPEVEELVGRARNEGVTAVLTVGTGVDDARTGLELRQKYPDFIHLSAGLDPFTSHRAGERFDDELSRLEEFLREGHCKAVGEIGLDYHYDLDPRPVQADRLRRQIELAERIDLPVIIHVREAHDDMIAILGEHPAVNGVIHSFTSGTSHAERYLELGWLLGFNGVVTFKNAPDVRDTARMVPDDRLIVETDSPYLAPVPLRGRRCEPAYVRHTLECVAGLRDVPSRELDLITTTNATKLFGLD